MTTAPIAFESAEGRYSFEGVAQLLNAYAEKRGPDAKRPMSVLPADGLVEFVDTTAGPCRGMIYLEDIDKLYSIHPQRAYKVTFDGTTATATQIGIAPGSDVVQLSRNQNATPQVVIRSDFGLQYIDTGSDTVIAISDTDIPSSCISADFVSGYTVYGFADRTFYISSINDSTAVDALDFATFQQRAGKLVHVEENAGELYGLCSNWLEVWRDTGNPDFPFEPLTFKPVGLLAPDAVVKCDQQVMFPGRSTEGTGNIYRLDNYTPTPVSTPTVARLIRSDASPEAIQAFSWASGGHAFANFTGSTWSRCFDAATQVWHTRQSYGYDTWRARHSVYAWGKTIVGDALSGKLFELDSDTYDEDGGTMLWGVDSPPLHVFPNGGIVDALHIDVATGYGLSSGQGSDPLIMLETSTDGGNTFTNYRELELGIQGTYSTRVTARRLGRFGPKGIVFRLRISDPVARAIVGTDVAVRPLKR